MEVPANKVYCINGKDLLEFWTESSNVASFEPCITSYPICLPTSDFNHRLQCLEDNIIKQTLEKENHFLVECNCSHWEVNSVTISNQTDALNCCESNKAFCEKSSGSDCCGTDDAKSGTKCYCASCDHGIQDGLSSSFKTEEILVDTLSDKLCIEQKEEDSSKEPVVLDSESSQCCRQRTLISETKAKNAFCKQCFFRQLQGFDENPPTFDDRLNILLLELYSSNFMEILEEATRRRVFNLPRGRTRFDRAITSHHEEACQSSLGGKTAKVGLLFSGGIDSMVLAAMADRYGFALSIVFLAGKFAFRFGMTSRWLSRPCNTISNRSFVFPLPSYFACQLHYRECVYEEFHVTIFTVVNRLLSLFIICAVQSFKHLFYGLGNYQLRHCRFFLKLCQNACFAFRTQILNSRKIFALFSQ